MISVNIICVGKLKEKYLRDASAEYIKRLTAFCKLNIIEIDTERDYYMDSKEALSYGIVDKIIKKKEL